jgi:peptidoglycan-associated lipoprotein
MKRSVLFNFLLIAAVLTLGGVGCKKAPKGTTPIPARTVRAPGPGPGPGPIGPGGAVPETGVGATGQGGVTSETLKTPEGFAQGDLETFEGMLMDPNAFATATVYFDFDSSVVKSTEQPKADSVADQLKLKPDHKLLIDGHCDERGTEEYNRALGERRALALREHLIGRGIGGERIRTRSWGEDRPVDPGHNEEAWAKNRRGEFILLLPQK